MTVGYNAFYPLPESFFKDPEAVRQEADRQRPVQGRRRVRPRPGHHASPSTTTTPVTSKAKADSVEFRVYTDVNTAYTDAQGGNLDILNNIPPDAIATAPDEFGDRYGETPSSSVHLHGLPDLRPPLRRQARPPGHLDGDRPGGHHQGDLQRHPHPGRTRSSRRSSTAPATTPASTASSTSTKANQLLDEAGFDRSKPIDLWFNAGAGHDAWVEAVGNQLRKNLGVEFTLQGNLDFAEYLPLGDAKGFTGPVPSRLEHGLPEPAELPGAAVRHGGSAAGRLELDVLPEPAVRRRSSPRATQAASATTRRSSCYQQAEDILLEDMPIMPMFFGLEQTVWSDKVDNVKIDIFGRVDVADGHRQVRLDPHDRRRGVPAAARAGAPRRSSRPGPRRLVAATRRIDQVGA